MELAGDLPETNSLVTICEYSNIYRASSEASRRDISREGPLAEGPNVGRPKK
jgi:hypothetical protein